MSAAIARGKKALEARNYDIAINEFTAAIQESPTSPDYYIQRSTAYLRAEKLDEALADAEQAVLNGQKRAKREAILEAQLRRGVVLYRLGRLGDAQFVLDLVKQRDEKYKGLGIWIAKVDLGLKNIPEDDPKRSVTVTETPDQPNISTATTITGATSTATTAPVKPPTSQQTPADKIRYEWYQNTENIYFTLLAKGVPKDKAVVEIQERSVEISFPVGADSSYQLHLEPLFAAVQPEKCITRVLPTKVEIILIKAQPGQKWSALETNEVVSPKDSVADTEAKAEDEAIKRAVFQEKPQGPAYPTSSKSGPKNWDKVAKESAAELRGDEAKPGDDDDDDDERGGDEANHFFRKLYKGASPDAQRAMMKSFTESNGTALSTNWEEVSKAPVETSPPDSMVAKEYPK